MPVYKSVDKTFFKKWTREMAYVLGFFVADGNMIVTKRGTHFLSFHSTDRSLLACIQVVMGSRHRLSKRSDATGDVYRFQIGSKEMFNDLMALGMAPNKSRRINMPVVPHRFIGDFVRGYFDGDGNVWSGLMNKTRLKPTHSLQVMFTSGSLSFLCDLHALLRSVDIQGGSVRKITQGEYGRLSYSTLDALKLYEIMYNMPHRLHLKRKKLVFERFVKLRV